MKAGTNKIIGAVLASLVSIAILATSTPADAQSVLRVARGLASNNIVVLENRAVVIESAEGFTEVSVAQPEIADVSPLSDRSIYIFGRARGATTLTLLGENGRLITNVTVTVQPDLNELKARLRSLLPGEPIQVRTAGAGLVLSGTVSGKAKIDRAMSLARAYGGDNVANMMSVGGTQQVSLKVRIAEIERSQGKSLGISTGLVGANERAIPFTETGSSITNNLGDGDVLNPAGEAAQFTNALPGAGAFSGVFGAIFAIGSNYLLDLQIDALQDKGFARLLAEPNLVALSGTEAEFLAGGEFPVPAIDDEGNVEVTFKPIGVSMNFRPTVLDDDLINVAVSAEVTSVDPSIGISSGGVDIVGFTTRRATTTVELRDGESFAIAGLYEDDFSDTVSQVPWLGEVPILGTFFRSTSFSRGESELVIIVSVDLVVPVSDISQLNDPLGNVAIPNERELFLLGNIEAPGQTGGVIEVQSQDFDGEFGYVVE
ncbi:MAG: type II and III secretion system protein family protein [Pseudomonadota bacterium]